jgi:ABC-type amino acid transport substrate-binding protein
MITKRTFFIILVFILIGGFVWADFPALRTGADIDYAPFSYWKNNGPAGFDIQFFSLLADRMGLETAYKLDTWHEILSGAQRGELDIILGAVYSQEREEYLTFTAPYNSMQLALVVPEKSTLKYAEDLRNKEMAVLKNDAVPRIFLDSSNIPVSAVSYPTLTEALRQLNSGRHDFAIIPEPYIDRIKNRKEFSGLRVANDNLSTLTYRIGVTEKSSHLLPEINTHIREMLESSEYKELRERWLFGGEKTGTEGRNLFSRPVLLLSIFGVLLFAGFFLFHIALRKDQTMSI